MHLPSYIDIESNDFLLKFSKFLFKMIKEGAGDFSDIVFVCIGTDRATGDSLGPLTGTMLQRSNVINVYGTLEEPVHALNLGSVTDMIYKRYEKPFVIAVDASLGMYGHIGCVTISRGALCPGSAMSKNLGSIGNIAITGIVNSWGVNSLSVLQSTRLSLVMRMADMLSNSIYIALANISSLIKSETEHIV